MQLFPDNYPASKAQAYPASEHEMGPVTNADGSVTFCLGAPGKSNVTIVGSWNDYALVPSQSMNYQDVNGIRYFWATIPDLADGKDHIY